FEEKTTDDDVIAEERWISTTLYDKLGKAALKLPVPQKLKFAIWRKADWNYKTLQDGLCKKLSKDVYEYVPRFDKVLLKFGVFIRSQR
ncbi:hypothetical protein L917_09803, partial [Phytophthora nicotianae]